MRRNVQLTSGIVWWSNVLAMPLSEEHTENLRRWRQAELRYMAQWTAQMEAAEAARAVQLQRVAAIQSAQAKEAQVRASNQTKPMIRLLAAHCGGLLTVPHQTC